MRGQFVIANCTFSDRYLVRAARFLDFYLMVLYREGPSAADSPKMSFRAQNKKSCDFGAPCANETPHTMKLPKRLPIITAGALLAGMPFVSPVLVSTCFAQAAVTAENDVTAIYGLASRLPKSTEGFASLYRLSDLWEGFKKSNLVKQVLANEELVRELDLDDIEREYSSNGEFKQAIDIAGALAGMEIMVALPQGFTKEFTYFLKNITIVLFGTRMSGLGEDPGMPPEAMPMLEIAAGMNVPPVILAAKAGAAKAPLQSLIAQALSEITGEAAEKISRNKFFQDGVEFESLSIKMEKAMDADDKEKMVRDLKKAAKDDAKGEALAKKLLSKSAELTWGWIDDYLIISIGTDHSHLKFVSPADSVLTHPDLTPRAAQWAAKNPFGLTYTSKETFQAMNAAFSLVDSLTHLEGFATGLAKAGGVALNVDKILDSLKKLSAKSNEVWSNNPDAVTGALWWDGGLHAELFGGNKPRWFDNSKPLSIGSLATDTTVFLSQSRANESHRDTVFGLFEEVVTTLFEIYQTEVKSVLPSDTKQGLAMGEMIGLPLAKEIWKSIQSFRGALGGERGILVNLDGKMPSIPEAGIPADIQEKGLIPRIAVVAELKDRAKLTESWGGVKDLLGSMAALIGSQTGANIKTTPVEKRDGALSMYGFELPMDTGDVWPHAAVSETRWMFSTSPSFSKELAAKTSAPAGPALGHHTKFTGAPLWNYVDGWLKLAPLSGKEKENAALLLKVARMLHSTEIRFGEAAGQSHDKVEIHMTDLK